MSDPAQSILDLELSIEQWLAEQVLAPVTIICRRSAVRRFLLFAEPDLPTTAHFSSWISHHQQSGSDLTARGYFSVVRGFFRWCSSAGVFPDITESVRPPRHFPHRRRRGSMSMNQVQQLLLSVRRSGQKSGRDFALIYLMLSTGIRRIEASRSNICDLVNRGDRTTLLVQGKGHNSKDDFVIVHPEVLEVLQHYISRRHGPRNYRAPLFLNEGTHSGRLLPYTITRIVRHALDEAGLGGFNLTTHSLRATTATLMYQSGADIRQVKSTLRHTNIATTELYTAEIDRLRDPGEDFLHIPIPEKEPVRQLSLLPGA